MQRLTALINATIFDGEHWHSDKALVLANDKIRALVPASGLEKANYELVDLTGLKLIPGLIDTQVNGGGGALLNDKPSVATLCTIGDAHRKLGTTSFLPTLISDDLSVVGATIKAVSEAMAKKVPGVIGVHLEGPFLNSLRKGVHNAEKFKVIDEQAFELLTSLKSGKTYVTLAPECTTPEMIKRLADAGVIVAAGHTAATYEETKLALDSGLKAFTHLFNAMTPLTSREPGVVGAALEDHHSWCGIIVDNYHVAPATLRVAIAAKAKGKMVLVTDAMPTVGASEKSFILNGEKIFAKDGRCATANDTLAGSDLDMIGAVKNTHELLGLALGEAIRMASTYPAEMLGMASELGQLKPDFRANCITIDDDFNVHHSWIDGQLVQYI
ncbi:N-acetylglucosamine-6-phosphate deacetylase [Simiduia curdlanivorans]|uniref:N-acetylglucosamine-6-phosphate deacetylase n=1 Tax=Simiduia curdlanivorans TaxID=1492769 RepID=A0ABV8V5R1_9GAMM|nr:N-acetylglucosamine-6-phosphate deacetylase [Simiduia curdlanivorans]MDN3639287.1 N-acetylglucosamine-6-phosphate deacetylase [Simiduia curdlanivorans]